MISPALKPLLLALLPPPALLLIPAGAMLLQVDGWAWQAADFLAAGVLLTGSGLAFRLITLAQPAAPIGSQPVWRSQPASPCCGSTERLG